MISLLKWKMVRFSVKKSNCLFFDRYRTMSINICSIILIILFIVFILFSIFYKINFSTSYNGFVVKGDRYYVNMVLSDNDIQCLQKTKLVVDGQIINYSINSISDEYVLTENGSLRSVLLDFEIPIDKRIVNNVIKLNFIEKTTIFNKVKEMFI